MKNIVKSLFKNFFILFSFLSCLNLFSRQAFQVGIGRWTSITPDTLHVASNFIPSGNNTFVVNDSSFLNGSLEVELANSENITLWTNRVVVSGNQQLLASSSDKDGNLYIFGAVNQFFGSLTLMGGRVLSGSHYFIKINSNGNIVWASSFTGNGAIAIRSATIISKNGFAYLCASFLGGQLTYSANITFSTQPSAENLMILRFNPQNGLGIWGRQSIANSGFIFSSESADINLLGDLFVAGRYAGSSTGSIGGFTVQAPSINDNLYITKCSSSGVFNWLKIENNISFTNSVMLKYVKSLNSVVLAGSLQMGNVTFSPNDPTSISINYSNSWFFSLILAYADVGTNAVFIDVATIEVSSPLVGGTINESCIVNNFEISENNELFLSGYMNVSNTIPPTQLVVKSSTRYATTPLAYSINRNTAYSFLIKYIAGRDPRRGIFNPVQLNAVSSVNTQSANFSSLYVNPLNNELRVYGLWTTNTIPYQFGLNAANNINVLSGNSSYFIATLGSSTCTYCKTNEEESGISLLENSNNNESTIELGSQLQVFPNPFNELLSVTFDSAKEEAASINIYNTMGQKVYSQLVYLQVGKNNIDLNPEWIVPGTYLINTMNEQGEMLQSTRIVKAKQ